jgi:hypothetical protein
MDAPLKSPPARKTRSRATQIAGWATPLMLSPWLSIAGVTAAYAYFGPEVRFVPRDVVFGVGLALGVVTGALFVLASALIDIAILAIAKRTLPQGVTGWVSGAFGAALFTASYAVLKPWTYWRGGPWTVVGLFVAPPIVAALVSRIAVLARKQPS